MWFKVWGPESSSVICDITAISSPGLFSTKPTELFKLEPFNKTMGALSLIVVTKIVTSRESLNAPSDVMKRAIIELESGSDKVFTYCRDVNISVVKLELIGPLIINTWFPFNS